MKIVDFSLRKKVTVSMVVLVIVIYGFIAFRELGLDMLPDIELPYISVITSYSGVSSEDMEESITRPLEQWVSTVSHVKQVKSTSQEGLSIILVEFDSGTNLDFAAQDVREKISQLEAILPEGAENPMVVKFNFQDMPIMMYGITGGNQDLRVLKDHIDKEVAARLERLEGVASAMLFSPEETEVLINVDKGKLEARGLSISQVERAVQASNINLPSGFMNESYKEYQLRTIGEFEKVEEIQEVVVGAGTRGEPIFLRDIAQVEETNKELRNLVRINGTKGLMLIVTKSSGSNTVLVAREVKKTLEEIKPTLEKDIQFSVAMDFSRIIEIMAGKSSNDILMGSLLAMLLIWLFLWSFRPTLAIGISIPLSVLATFIAMRMVGYTLNLITMSGLALGVGMMVDNSIVVIESIFRHLEEGKTPHDAAFYGTTEVGMAITASTLTTIAVFFPMMFATGISGIFSKGLALSISFALLASLFVALTIIPMMASWFFRATPSLSPTNPKKGSDLGYNKFTMWRNFYQRTLTRALERRKLVLLVAIGAFILSLVICFFLGTEFLPDQDRAMLFLKLSMPVGTNLEETNRVVKYIENQSMHDKNVITTLVNVGISEQNAQDSASGFGPEGSYEATFWAYLLTRSQRELTDKQILEQWRQNFPQMKTGKIQFMDMGATAFGMSTTSPIEFNIFGRELDTLKRIAQKVKTAISPIKGLRDVQISLNESKPEVRIKIKKEEASRLGLTTYDISHQVQTFTIGTVVSRIMLGGEERDIRVRLEEKDRNTLEALQKLPIVTPQGTRVYLSQVAELKKSLGAVKINRENQIRKVSVTANYVDRDLGGLVKEITEKTRDISADLPWGYFYQMGGAYKDMQEAFTTMALALVLALVLVFAVMASQFENLKSPFIIMFTIPLALIGCVIALVLTGLHINLPVIMGFIMLAGIVVNNGIVMVDYINQLIGRGVDKLEAVIDGAVIRLRPVLITALTTVVGMFPMAVASGEGAEMRSPLAITMIGGLTAATFLTLIIVPILYTYFSKIKVKSPQNT